METDNNISEKNPLDDQIDKFEIALKSFVGIYNFDLIENRTNQELNKKIPGSGVKTHVELRTSELIEEAHNLETMFLKYRHEIIKNAPEQLIEEEIECLKAELKRKDDLIGETRDKLGNLEQQLKFLDSNLDNQLKSHLDISTYGFTQK